LAIVAAVQLKLQPGLTRHLHFGPQAQQLATRFFFALAAQVAALDGERGDDVAPVPARLEQGVDRRIACLGALLLFLEQLLGNLGRFNSGKGGPLSPGSTGGGLPGGGSRR